MEVYLDNAATTPLSPSMQEYLISLLDVYGNPSSLHSQGQQAKELITKARQRIAAFIHGKPDEIYFTPSGSASNTLAIRGYYREQDCELFYSPIAHKSILTCAEAYPHAHPLKVSSEGLIDLEALGEQLTMGNRKIFVIVDYANSEIGTIQEVERLIALVHSYHGIVYLDCTGSISAIPLDVKRLQADMCGFSGHKLGGLKGCGVLYKKSNIELEPLICGSQEQGLIGGTENVLGIASLGKAVENDCCSSISSQSRDYVYHSIISNIPDVYLVGSSKKRLPHNLYLCFKGIDGESLMLLLDMNGIQVSTGSACNSRSLSPSAVLSAIGMAQEDRYSCIRMTFSGRETREELDYVCKTLDKCVNSLRKINTL